MALVEINWRPDRRQLKQFAVLWIGFFGLLAACSWWFKDSRSATAVLLLVTAAGFVGYFRPGFLRPAYVIWMALALPIGWTMSHLLLLAMYYLLITPIGLLMRLIGYDPLERRVDRSAATYWTPHDPGADASRYFRQF